jgi:signal transduction histidine kinase
MIHLSLILSGNPANRYDTDKPMLSIGRSANNDIHVPADNASSQHAQICLIDGGWIFRDLKSTNGSMVVRGGKRYLINREPREMLLQPGDQICLASSDNLLVVEAIDAAVEFDSDGFEQTILAEQEAKQPAEIETSLSDDFEALRTTVELARELSSMESVDEIAELACRLSLKAFPKARHALFLQPAEGRYVVKATRTAITDDDPSTSTLTASPQLIGRCLNERKGFLFLFEQDRMQAIATRVVQSETVDPGSGMQDKVVLCCPLLHQDHCRGFLEIVAPLDEANRSSLTRRDLALATLMGHLLAARLNDLAQLVERLKLTRKATTGFMAAMVGHCFKNMLVVPMMMTKTLPMCVKQGQMNEVEWMLARNGVNIQYLNILSNEFASASKDPTEGFGAVSLGNLLGEVAELINQMAPEKVEAVVNVPNDFPQVVCHPQGLKRLLMNLTLNAVDAIFGQSGRAEKGCIEMRVENHADDETFVLSVRDNGPGMPEEILVRLRGIHDRVQASADALGELQEIAEEVRSTKEHGLKEHYGLGFLFICLTICQHQGGLQIEAAPGVGTLFTLELPRQGPAVLKGKQAPSVHDTN